MTLDGGAAEFPPARGPARPGNGHAAGAVNAVFCFWHAVIVCGPRLWLTEWNEL